ncbi:MAG: hypothetical protein OXE52_09210 [Chloroflexi bacterium]|nr:hypothetical protein [Chloroflexota bacterium]
MTLPPIPEGKTRLLLVEGSDDKMFFESLVAHLESKAQQLLDLTGFEVLPFGGAQNLVNSLELLARDPRYDKVSHIGIVRDSDYNTDAFASVCSAINRFNSQPPTTNLPVPREVFLPTDEYPRVSVLTMPLNSEGTLESVVLTALKDDAIMSCVNDYFTCIENADIYTDLAENRLPKSKLAVLIAGKSADRNSARVPDVKRRLLHNVYSMTWLPNDFWENESFDDAKSFLTLLLAP